MKAPGSSFALVAILGVLGTLGLHGQAQAPASAPQTFNPQEKIPVDAAVREGKLPNGVMYVIRRNGQPAKRVSLRLGVKAGSLYESDDQQGLAHLIEHMAFNGSTHFKPGEVFSYFESVGAQLGPHVNASTSFDQTIYMLDLPTEKPEVVNNGLTALSDFAGGLTLDPEQIDKERGVVIEEWRRGLGAGSRIRDKQMPDLFYRSRYAERLPIGKPDVIRAAPASRLKAFYDAWYRPDRLAVIAVGDVDPEQTEAAIRNIFGPLRARGAALPPPDMNVPLHRELLVNVTTDPELTSSSVEIISKRPRESEQLVSDYRRTISEMLFHQMFDERFNELARKPDAKFLAAGAGGGPLTPDVATFQLSARVREGGLAEALAALGVEARRVREYGFTEGELARAKQNLLSGYSRAYNERDKTESPTLAAEYLRHFFVEEPIPGIVYEYRLVQWALPTITLQEMSALARARLADESRVILALTPEKSGVTPPTTAQLRASLDSVARVAVTPWSDSTVNRPLIERLPTAGTLASRRELPELGITVVKFSNGLEAWLKPTDFKNDQILFSMYAMGGASVAPPADFVQASMATRYVGLSGYGGLSAVDLQKVLSGKRITVSPSIAMSTHSMSGSAAPADFESALQLLYQEFTSPNGDAEAFALMKRQLEAAVANRGQAPGQVFGDRLDEINTSNHYTSRPLTAELVASLDPAKMLAFYKARFGSAADFTMFMVGAFQVDTALPLLARYVGSLPSTGTRTAQFKDLGIKFPTDVVRETVRKGREPVSQTVMSFYADLAPAAVEQERAQAATFVLETTLREVLREDLGQTYTVSVGLAQSYPQRGDGHVQVSFNADPQNIDGMIDRVMQEVRRLQDRGPAPALVEKAKESARRTYETSLKENGYWMGRMQRVHMIGSDPKEILSRPERIQAITPAIVQDMLKQLFPMNRYTVVTLKPEPVAAR